MSSGEIKPQDVIRERIRQVFPDAPEQCLDCPGLARIAKSVLLGDEMFGETAMRADNPNNPLNEPGAAEAQDDDSILNWTEMISRVHEVENIKALEAAKNLWSCCSGAVEVSTRSDADWGWVRTFRCGSQNPITSFLIDPIDVYPVESTGEFLPGPSSQED